MAETNVELDTIKHLLDIEKEAATLIDEAKIEADKRVLRAKTEYNEQYKKEYDALTERLESEYNQNCAQINKKYEDELEDFKKSLADIPLNTQDFNKTLEQIFFA